MRHYLTIQALQKEKRRVDDWRNTQKRNIETKPNYKHEMIKLDAEYWVKLDTIDENIASEQTRYLMNEAKRYGLPTPYSPGLEMLLDQTKSPGPDSEWTKTNQIVIPLVVLKQSAMVELRSAIRKEKKERREAWQSSVALAIGLIGALIGLVSALKK